MSRRIKARGAVLLGTSLTVLGAASPAHADVVCKTSSNAYQYNRVDAYGGVGSQEFTLHADRGFHSYQFYVLDGYNRWWVKGYGAEHPDNDGFILLSHTNGKC